jgi:hypothetical protein
MIPFLLTIPKARKPVVAYPITCLIDAEEPLVWARVLGRADIGNQSLVRPQRKSPARYLPTTAETLSDGPEAGWTAVSGYDRQQRN